VAAHFRTPRANTAPSIGPLGGELTREKIVRDWDALVASGIFVVNSDRRAA